jgi:hypothetical protein
MHTAYRIKRGFCRLVALAVFAATARTSLRFLAMLMAGVSRTRAVCVIVIPVRHQNSPKATCKAT